MIKTVFVFSVATILLFSVSAKALTLGQAVDNTSLTWNTGGDASWFGQSAIFYYGGDAAQSGNITNSQSSYLQMVVNGPGTISYYWKVSSEASYDYLRFYIDSKEQTGKISGTANWSLKSFNIPSGTHTLKWAFTKDSSISTGSDCGWVDKVIYTALKPFPWTMFLPAIVNADSPPPPPPPPVRTVISAGQIWMDRNLGASRVAMSSTDSAAYGDLYQWGRLKDGHEKRSSSTTRTLSTKDAPGHALFIKSSNRPWDWRSPQNNSLWQGVAGKNNPCPSGFRLPTETEWQIERNSWSQKNATGAFRSPLKLTKAGARSNYDGDFGVNGSDGFYWGSTVTGTWSGVGLWFDSDEAGTFTWHRAGGSSVRCIKD